ncbi:MAG: bacteriorhodopsin-like [Pseudobdellovibrionaceae bacterium]|jgi:bacteriorhodopsin
MIELSSGQYSLVFNMLSFAVASMLGSFAFFVMAQKLVGAKYRASMIVSSLVVLIAGYHYWRIMGSWEAAYQLTSTGSYAPTGKPFNDAYRYVDWLLTVPLLLVELILVLNLAKGQTGSMLAKLIIAAVLMIGLGYPGEISGESGTRHLWGTLSSIPFLYILYVLWIQLGASLKTAPESVRSLFANTRWLLLATWGFYPIAYLIGTFGGTDSVLGTVGIQIGYSIADVTAKCLYGVMIFAIAYEKSRLDGSLPSLKEA